MFAAQRYWFTTEAFAGTVAFAIVSFVVAVVATKVLKNSAK